MAIVSESKKDSSCSGRKRPNPNKRKTVRKAELKSKLMKLSDRRGFIAEVELRAPACSNHGKTDRPVKKIQRHFRCQESRDGQGTDDAVFTRNVNPSKAI